MAHGLHDRDDGYCRARLSCRLIAISDDFHRREGAHAVVNGHHALGIVGNPRESVQDAVETSLSTVGNLARYRKMVLAAQFPPVVLLVVWQYEDDGDIAVFPEPHDGAHQDRDAANLQKLLGHIGTHAQSLTTSEYDCVVHGIVYFSLIRCT